MPELAIDWRAVRAEFPALERWTFLNTATYGQLPRRAVDAMAGHLARRDEFACSDFLSWFDDADDLRASLARLIHCSANDIAFVPNAATALGTLLNGIDWRPGDRIITLANEFPNNIYHASVLGARGVEFVETRWERFYDALTPATRLVLLSEVNYTNGFRAPLAELARAVRQRGALLYVDGTQSLGALQFDVREIDPDMYAVDGYKWLLSPNGAGFAYVRPSMREWLQPSVVGWRSHRNWREVHHLHAGKPEFSPDAERYEGGILSFPALYGMQASVDLLLELGPEAIERRVMELAAYLRETLRRLGARLLYDDAPELYRSPVVAARLEGRDAELLCAALKQRRVLISSRFGNLRISTHFYNTEEDVDRLAACL